MKHHNPHQFLQPNVCGLIVTTDKECAFKHTYKTTNTFMVFDKGYVIGKQNI